MADASVDPQDTFEYVLAQHRELPKDKQPTLIFRFLSYRDWKRMTKLFDQADTPSNDDGFDAAFDAARIALAGWRNFPIEFAPKELEAILTTWDMIELRNRLPMEMSLAESKKKASLWRSQSSTAQSASGTTAAAVTVPNSETPKAS